jgi:hypothetical protein
VAREARTADKPEERSSRPGAMETLTTPYNPFPKFHYCNNTLISNEETCWFVHIDFAFFIKVISMGFIILFGLIGNSLLALAIILSERLRSKSVNFLIVFLCISNILCFLLVAPFIVVDSVTEFYVLGEFLCKTQPAVQIFFFVVPMLTLLFISIDRSVLLCKQPIKRSFRYLAIRYPFRYQNWDWKILLACSFTLLVGGVTAGYVFNTKTVQEIKWADVMDTQCINTYVGEEDHGTELNSGEWRQKRYFWFSILNIVFVIPFLGTLLFYCRILYKIREVDRQLLGLHAKAHNRSLQRVVVMVLTVLSTTILCWAPITTYWMMLYAKRCCMG